jgi:hypothetical protein
MSRGMPGPSGYGQRRLGPLSHPVDVDDAVGDVGQQLARVEPPERSLGDQQGLPNDCRGVLHLFLYRERRLDRVRGAQVFPVRFRELVEGDQPLPVLVEGLADAIRRLAKSAWRGRRLLAMTSWP